MTEFQIIAAFVVGTSVLIVLSFVTGAHNNTWRDWDDDEIGSSTSDDWHDWD